MAGFEELKEQYWRTLAYTRKSGRISPNVKKKTEAQWEKYPREIVEEALRIHIRQYRDPSYKENYTLGIMRNLSNRRRRGYGNRRKGKIRSVIISRMIMTGTPCFKKSKQISGRRGKE